MTTTDPAAMSTADGLADLRHNHPIYFWVWSKCLALAANTGWPAAINLHRIVRLSTDPTAIRVRSTLNEMRAYVAQFRTSHDPQCACEWDRGAMWVIEAVDAALTPEGKP